MRTTDLYLETIVGETRTLLQKIATGEGHDGALKEETDYYDPRRLRPIFITMSSIHLRLCDSIRNTSRMRLVITDERFHRVRSALAGCSLDSLCSDGITVVTRIVEQSCQVSSAKLNTKRSWRTFAQGVVDSACYLSRFKEPKHFYDYVDGYTDTPERAWSLAEDLDHKIKGVGRALACDFLKEIGVDRYSKPDTQIIKTFRTLNLIDGIDEQKEAFDIIWQMAELTGLSPAVIDKILWIAASGRWDRTLDKTLPTGVAKRQQMRRKELFGVLLDRLKIER